MSENEDVQEKSRSPKRSELTKEELRDKKEFAELLLDTVREGLLVLDDSLRIKMANESFYQLFRVSPEETEGVLLYELGNHQWDIPELRTLLEQILPEDEIVNDYEIEHDFEKIGYRIMLLNARRIDHLQLILLAIEDITERKKALREVKSVNDTLEERIEERTGEIRKLISRLTDSEQQERRRISGILHDDLQQVLFAIQINLEILQEEIDPDNQKHLSKQVSETIGMTKESIEKTRRLTNDLNPPVLQSPELTGIMEWVAERFYERYDLETELKENIHFTIPDREVRVVLLHSVRELLFNIVKHAGTGQATIKIDGTAGELMAIEVIDEGSGFNPKEIGNGIEKGAGFGLYSIFERLNLFGGSLEIESAPGEGTRMTIQMPVHPVED